MYPNRYLLYVGTAIGVITLLWPGLAQWISWGWYKLAEGLGYINSRILQTVLFLRFCSRWLCYTGFLTETFSHCAVAAPINRCTKIATIVTYLKIWRMCGNIPLKTN